MLDENAVSECGTKPVCISGIYLLCFYWQVLWLKFASVTVYYPVHTRGCENFRIALKKQWLKMEIKQWLV